MKKRAKRMTVQTAMLVALCVAAAACTNGGGNLAEPSTGEGNTAAGQERKQISMFMGDSGLPYPDGIDPADNPYIRLVEDYANVDLSMEVPSAQDIQTKFNLMMSSAKLPDVVHTWFSEEAERNADNGAFIDLKSYYDNSPVVQRWVTPEMMELAKSKSGHYYRIPMPAVAAPQGKGVIARYDLVMKYNDGQWPATVDEWLSLLRKIKQAEPESVLMSSYVEGDIGLTFTFLPFFYWHGALPYTNRVQDGEVVSTFTLPEYKATVEIMKQLYDEGILDKEFATNDQAKYGANFQKNMLFMVNSANQYIPNNSPKFPSPEAEWQFAPALASYPAALKDSKYAQTKQQLPITAHGLYISSQSKDPDRAWKVIEGFASQELYDAIFWGKEGEDYDVVDGSKLPIEGQGLANPDKYYSLHLALLFGFDQRKEASIAAASQVLAPEELQRRLDGLAALDQEAAANGMDLTSFLEPSDEALLKTPEANKFITQTTVEAIMGAITMEQFDEKVNEFKSKYGFIQDEMTQFVQENKDRLRALGVKEIDW
ncbi:extracellular solute-binding protein [Paenibacillus sp. 598K]|uniref:extracellular solute-binding protein n=1 Tax=Paenibacillus sp. 598K TaxID=1117987 RepID=UPI000FFE78A6|nr:extracellular solute-binding protein [Paenibacillus sp. 598K]